MYPHPKFGQGRQKNRGVKVTLHSRPVADIHPCLVNIDPPIHTHHVAARRVQLAEKAGGACAEMDHGNTRRANTLDQRARVRCNESNVVIRTQCAYPTSKT